MLARTPNGRFSRAIHWDWKLVLALAVNTILAGTYLVTSLRSVVALRSHKKHGKRPPILPHWIPFVGSVIPEGSPDHTNALFKTTQAISSNSGVAMATKNVFGTPSDVVPVYDGDDSGPLTTPVAGSHVLPENRIRFFHWRAAHHHLASAGINLGDR